MGAAMPREIITRRALIAASPLLAAPALAQAPFPNRPIRLVVGFTPGGATDISARAFAPKMSEVLGQPVIVENRPGAGSNLATEIVARSPADGYTILLATLGALVISPMVMRLPIDPARDLVPISIAVDLFNILTVPAERPWNTAADIIAAAKARPGELSWGHSGIGSAPQLAGLLFAKMAGIETIEVSYRGGGLVATDLISGRLDYGFPTSPSVKTHIEAGRLRGLAVPTLQRSRLLPNIPTVAETGLPGFNVPSWYAVVAPRGTPEPAVERMAHAMRIALEDRDVIGILNRNGLEAMPSTPAEFAAAWAAERTKWEPIIRESGIKIE
jgi:tripartite-type tricarboxylate transporter receptor subunit TctC